MAVAVLIAVAAVTLLTQSANLALFARTDRMSVIENAINKLRASRAGGAAAARHKEYDAATSGGGAARRREVAPEGNAGRLPAPSSSIRMRYASRGLLPPSHQERELAQQFRQIKRPLINNALGRGVAPLPQGNLVMVARRSAGRRQDFHVAESRPQHAA